MFISAHDALYDQSDIVGHCESRVMAILSTVHGVCLSCKSGFEKNIKMIEISVVYSPWQCLFLQEIPDINNIRESSGWDIQGCPEWCLLWHKEMELA